MFVRPLEYVYPNFQLPAINDGWFQSWLPLDLYEAGYDRLRLPEIGWAVSELRRSRAGGAFPSPDVVPMWTVIHGIPAPADPIAPSFKSTNFDNIGIATLRLGKPATREMMLTFDYGRFLGHGQFDKMGVTFFAGSRLLMADYGTPSYGSKILEYYKGTASHNCIMIDNKNQLPGHKNGLKYFQPLADGITAVSAETTETTPGVDWTRTVALCDDYAMVLDDLKSSAPHQYDCLFHAEGTTVSLLNGPGRTIPVLPALSASGIRKLPFAQYLTSGEAFTARAGSFSADWKTISGALAVHLAAAASQPVQVIRCLEPAETGARQIPLVIQRVNSQNAQFATVLQPATDPKSAQADHIEVLEANGTKSWRVSSRLWVDTWEDSSKGMTRKRAKIHP
jgi:hypothetical protein